LRQSTKEIKKPNQYVNVTKISRKEWNRAAVQEAIKKELVELFEELKALRPIRRASIKSGTKLLKSHMFIVEKCLACGAVDKLKALLVADGKDQDREVYPDRSYPTVATHSVFTVIGMVPGNLSWLVPTKFDVKGAFVQTPMKGPPMFMKIDPTLSKFVVKLYSEYDEFLGVDGSLTTELLKAMYSCIQVSRLWFYFIVSILKGLGYQQSPTDPCIMRNFCDGKIFIVLIYVDDLMVLVT
jgi:hypothetical protein